MTRDDLGARVRATITEHMASTYRGARGTPEVTDDSKLTDGLRLDSLDLVEITVELEDRFDLEMNDERVSRLVTVGELIEYLAEALGIAAVSA